LEKKNCPILIGPEGDFTNLEVEKLIQSGYQPITLGKTRLRTETAGIYSCALSKSIFE
jgi:16S rRNA (uracil1498-N3)-methyltransferase